MDQQAVLTELVRMSRELGRPENDYVVLGEGNTSAKIDDDFFYVKASGKYLVNADDNTFVKVRLKDAAAILDSGDMTDIQIKDALQGVCADPANKMMPSVETTFHAFLLSVPGINFVGHTHAAAVNAMLCSVNAEEFAKGRIYPDHIVYCGIESIYIPYVDPGLVLARTIRDEVNAYIKKHGVNPKEILVQNHGHIALGKTSGEVEAITAMACKAARVISAAHQYGGVRFLTDENVNRIYTRPDEAYRQAQMK